MASVRRHPHSPYWMADFYLPGGRRTNRSTGTTNKKEAQRIANQFEDAARAGQSGRLTETRARKTIADIYAISNNDILASSTTRSFLESWIKRKEIESEARTAERYSSAADHVLKYLGAEADRDISFFSSKAIAKVRDKLAVKLSPSSANFAVKVMRIALGQARRDGLVETNEAAKVTLIQKKQKSIRRPFTMDELKRLLDVADSEWRGMILVGLYTGLRLGDVATLTWANIDLQRKELNVETQKTSRRVVLPLSKPVMAHLEDLPAGDDPKAPLFPRACGIRERNPHGGLSNQFYDIMTAAGLAKKRSHRSKGKGRSSTRQQNELSFHCLRHTATSLLKNAGVSDVVARDIIGHESEAVSRHYTHIEMAAKRKAVESMPDILG